MTSDSANFSPSSVTNERYITPSGLIIERESLTLPYHDAAIPLAQRLDSHRGVLLASSFEYPGRYTRWDLGFVDPPLALAASGRQFTVTALNARGQVLLDPIFAALGHNPDLTQLVATSETLSGRVRTPDPDTPRPEEQRSRQPSIFSLLRSLSALLASRDPYLGLYGAFGYDLTFQFDPITLSHPRPATQRDLVLYLPDEIIVVDHRRETAHTLRYDFTGGDRSTRGLPRTGNTAPYTPAATVPRECDHAPGAYAATVRDAIAAFRRGDLFEVVPSQTFYAACPSPPSAVFHRLRQRNPAPYGALMNLGQSEYLVAASPEMFVRVEGKRIETCPISGTIARGSDAISDHLQILKLLNSEKETAELTMCTDVDRNDKSRVCVPGSVRVLGRRLIEVYSRLIHTVDHVQGELRPECDALDGFLTHTWAVTVTGAPKQWAMQFIEDHERSPRLWYGGAIGFLGCDGNMNTGLTLRTVRIHDGVAQMRAGATLLYGSDPDAEEAETRLKAAALLDAIVRPEPPSAARPPITAATRPGTGRKIFMVDHQDSFVHTLAAYLRETGAEVVTYRAGFPIARLRQEAPDLVVLSPGPGRPKDFALDHTIAAVLAEKLPLFGVCLGLQGIVEHFGGQLGVLAAPMHGKASRVHLHGGRLFTGLSGPIVAGRYHSLYALREHLPTELLVTAETDDGIIMALEHRTLPIACVQFHPESILTLEHDVGRTLIANVVRDLR